MKRFNFILFTLLLASFLSQASLAQSGGQWGIVAESGVAVYKVQSFDSPVLVYLPKGKKVRISRKTYKGIGGLGAFYKIKYAPNKMGYVTDIDVVPEFGGPEEPKEEINPQFSEAKNPEAKKTEPVFFTKYIGGYLGQAAYSEQVGGKTVSANTLLYGLKLTGPGVLFDSGLLDLEVLLHSGAPSFYRSFTEAASGFLLITNFSMPAPLSQWDGGVAYYSLGLTMVLSKYNLVIAGTKFDSQELRLGVTGGLGAAVRIMKDWAVRGELKYAYEKTQYLSYGISVQHQY